jgi:hypothetical protein
MHLIGALFPGDAARCASYYNQSLLFAQGRPSADTLNP